MGFVKSYIQLFAYSSVTTEDWKAYLFKYFKDQVRNIWRRRRRRWLGGFLCNAGSPPPRWTS